MKISSLARFFLFAPIALATLSANAETRMQVAVGSTPIYSGPSADAQKVGDATSGEILFVARTEGDWAAISPPERLDLWLNKDFIEGNRVVAKSIQLRSGPGIQYDVVGTLARGAAVMPRGESGEWCKISPPSSAAFWVRKNDLSEVRTHTRPIGEVATVAPPAPAPAAPAPPALPIPPPAPQAAMPPPEPPAPPAIAPTPSAPVQVAASTPAAPVSQPVQRSAPAPAPAAPVAAPTPAPTVATVASAPKAGSTPAPQPPSVVPSPKAAPQPGSAPRAAVPAAPTLRPATAIPAAATPQPAPATAAVPRTPPPVRRAPAMPPVGTSVPATAGTVATHKPKDVGATVDPALVEDLDLSDLPNQGKPVQVEGELRNAPFMAAAPTRYRLQARDEDGVLEMICHVHGKSAELRGYVGKAISIRGREYWVEDSDMPVVVVGQIVPLAPASEPVMF